MKANKAIILAVALLGLLLVAWLLLTPPPPSAVGLGTNATAPPKLASAVVQEEPARPSESEMAQLMKPFEDFQQRPFEPAKETALHGWASEDGKAPEVIRLLAHNPLEEKRLLEENSRIQRRQLVYRKDTVASAIQRARLEGKQVTSIMLPGLDGAEIPVRITGSELKPSGQVGTLSGHVDGRPDSFVTVAFKFDREAFTVLVPGGTAIDAEPREPGQVIVKGIDPELYNPGLCGVIEGYDPTTADGQPAPPQTAKAFNP